MASCFCPWVHREFTCESLSALFVTKGNKASREDEAGRIGKMRDVKPTINAGAIWSINPMKTKNDRGGQPSQTTCDPSHKTRLHRERGINSKRLLFVTNTDGFGGAEKHLLELISRLRQPEVEAIIMQVGIPAYSDHLRGSESIPFGIKSERFRNSLWNWFWFFRRNRAEAVIFINGWVRSFPWYASFAAFLAGIPKCFSIFHTTPPTLAKIQGWSPGDVLRRLIGGRVRTRFFSSFSSFFFDAAICVGNAGRNCLVDDYRFPPRKTITIYNGVSLSEFAPSRANRTSVRTRLSIGAEEFLLVCVARLSNGKGLDILLRALDRLEHNGLSCKCIVVGDGPLKTPLVEQAEALGLRGRILFEGFHDDVRPFLQAADTFLLISYSEGFSLAIIEAMACGLPCIVTNVGGNPEAVHHMVHGLVVRPGSVEQAADAISFMATHPVERAEMSQRARARVHEEFDVEALMQETVRLILS